MVDKGHAPYYNIDKLCEDFSMNSIENGSIITTVSGEQLLVTKVFKKGVRALTTIKNHSRIRFIDRNLIKDTRHLHGDRFSYDLRQSWK